MKGILLFTIALISILSSCKKDETSNTAEVRYQFTSSVPDQYKMEYAGNGTLETENFTGTSWSKTINMKVNPDPFNPDIARLTVYPPATWVNTSANVNLKIYINSVLESNVDTVLKASDRGGVFTIISF